MADEIKKEKDNAGLPEEKFYYIVNPKGTIHSVNREHARMRLKQAGWRIATADEVAKLKAADGNQIFNKPLAKPFSPEPDLEPVLPDEK